MALVLVVDDNLAIREMVALALEKRGYQVVRADGYKAAVAAFANRRPDLVISDIYMPGGSGIDLLMEIQAGQDPPPLILMTAKGSIETAAQARQKGVFDYLAKPFDLEQMLERVGAALTRQPAPIATAEPGPESMIIGSHPTMVEVYKAISLVAPLNLPVMVLGETGTGKELVARALHQFSSSPRGPFVPVHCGGVPDTLIESELFGHRKGAFTDAQRDRKGALALADGGTVFLDEIGEISPGFQVKLLRFLEDGLIQPLGAEKADAVKVRVVAATHRDLRSMVAAGTFREDLIYRLSGYEIRIPPLRERLSDLPELITHFLQRYRQELGLAGSSGVSSKVLSLLEAHPWPGNVRELGHAVRRLLIEAGALEDPAIAQRVLRVPSGKDTTPASSLSPQAFQPPFLPLEELDRMYVLAVLDHAGGNKTEAARILGIERKTLARKLQKGSAEDLGEPDGGEP